MMGSMVAAWFAPAGAAPIDLPLTRLKDVSLLAVVTNHPIFKLLMPIPIIAAIAPLIWWFFHKTWDELDADATAHRVELRAAGRIDYRPMACFIIAAVVLTMQEYYGGRRFFDEVIKPELHDLYENGYTFLKVEKYDELYGYAWWVFARVVGYTLVPLPLWKILFPQDRLLDMGLHIRNFLEHYWVYLMCLAIVLPVLLLVAQQPDFGNYYPFYKNSSRSWADFLMWESMYWLQFFTLELFFRGWMIAALRPTLGAASIFAMALPYCMIHYGKPYLEAHGAVVAGVVLGSLSSKTKSIYAGFLVHITVAVSMDLLSLYKRSALPVTFWAPG